MIQAGRGQPEFLDRDAVGKALEAVRDQHLTRFDHGVYEVVVYGDALHQAVLVDGRAKILASLSGVIAVFAAGGMGGRVVGGGEGGGGWGGGTPAAIMPMAVPVRDPERERVA